MLVLGFAAVALLGAPTAAQACSETTGANTCTEQFTQNACPPAGFTDKYFANFEISDDATGITESLTFNPDPPCPDATFTKSASESNVAVEGDGLIHNPDGTTQPGPPPGKHVYRINWKFVGGNPGGQTATATARLSYTRPGGSGNPPPGGGPPGGSPPGPAELVVTKTASNRSPDALEPVTFTVTVKNIGDSTAPAVRLTDFFFEGSYTIVPGKLVEAPNCTFTDNVRPGSAGTQIICSLGDIEAHGTRTVVVKYAFFGGESWANSAKADDGLGHLGFGGASGRANPEPPIVLSPAISIDPKSGKGYLGGVECQNYLCAINLGLKCCSSGAPRPLPGLARSKRRKQILAATGKADLDAGQTGRIPLKMTKPGLRALKRAHRLKVHVTGTSTDAAGDKTPLSGQLLLRLARSK